MHFHDSQIEKNIEHGSLKFSNPKWTQHTILAIRLRFFVLHVMN